MDTPIRDAVLQSKGLGPKQGSYIPPRTISKGKSGGSGALSKGTSGALPKSTSGVPVVNIDASAKK